MCVPERPCAGLLPIGPWLVAIKLNFGGNCPASNFSQQGNFISYCISRPRQGKQYRDIFVAGDAASSGNNDSITFFYGVG